MSLMNDRVMTILLEEKPPHPGLKFQPVEYQDHLNITLFLDNFAEFSDPQRQDLAVWIGSLVQKIRDIGVPCYLEAVESEEVKRPI